MFTKFSYLNLRIEYYNYVCKMNRIKFTYFEKINYMKIMSFFLHPIGGKTFYFFKISINVKTGNSSIIYK